VAKNAADNEAFRRFVRRVWRNDVTPLLRDKYALQRKKSARVGGKLAAATGLFVDSVFRLKGKPFTRFMTVMGSSVGAMLPDVWDWRWLRRQADPADLDTVAKQLRRRADELPEADALSLFGLAPSAEREQLTHAWRNLAQRWHPDKADNEQRAEFQVRFVTYQAAYERLCRAYDDGRLPRPPQPLP
jgi:hypothetical protein